MSIGSICGRSMMENRLANGLVIFFLVHYVYHMREKRKPSKLYKLIKLLKKLYFKQIVLVEKYRKKGVWNMSNLKYREEFDLIENYKPAKSRESVDQEFGLTY